MLLEEEISRWKGFRKALRKKDQEAFDRLVKKARTHSSAAGYQVTTNTFETMVMAVLLEMEKAIGELEKRIEKDHDKGLDS